MRRGPRRHDQLLGCRSFRVALTFKEGKWWCATASSAARCRARPCATRIRLHLPPLDEPRFAWTRGPRTRTTASYRRAATAAEAQPVSSGHGRWVAPKRDAALIASIERHRARGRVEGPGRGFQLPAPRGPRLLGGSRFAQRDRGRHQRARHAGGGAAAWPRQAAASPSAAAGGRILAPTAAAHRRPALGRNRSRRGAITQRAGQRRGPPARLPLLPAPFGTLSFLPSPVIPAVPRITHRSMWCSSAILCTSCTGRVSSRPLCKFHGHFRCPLPEPGRRSGCGSRRARSSFA